MILFWFCPNTYISCIDGLMINEILMKFTNTSTYLHLGSDPGDMEPTSSLILSLFYNGDGYCFMPSRALLHIHPLQLPLPARWRWVVRLRWSKTKTKLWYVYSSHLCKLQARIEWPRAHQIPFLHAHTHTRQYNKNPSTQFGVQDQGRWNWWLRNHKFFYESSSNSILDDKQ